jgi:hypothetical protein
VGNIDEVEKDRKGAAVGNYDSFKKKCKCSGAFIFSTSPVVYVLLLCTTLCYRNFSSKKGQKPLKHISSQHSRWFFV